MGRARRTGGCSVKEEGQFQGPVNCKGAYGGIKKRSFLCFLEAKTRTRRGKGSPPLSFSSLVLFFWGHPPGIEVGCFRHGRDPSLLFLVCSFSSAILRSGLMGHLSNLLNGLVKSLSTGKGRTSAWSGTDSGREAADAMARDARKNDMILRSSGAMGGEGSGGCFVSVFSRRGEKGVNQDGSIVWKEFGGQDDMIFCGIFDGHGSWGHLVAKMVRESLPSALLCNWQETLILNCLALDLDLVSEKKLCQFDVWKQSYLRTCDAIDRELKQHRGLDSFYSGTTALTVIKQGDLIVLANVGDSRAVLATRNDDGSLAPMQLTVDFKPNLPHEAERIMQCNGRVFCLDDEPGVHRVWLPDKESPGLAMSRAFGDYCVKDFGLISVPEVTHRNITSRDQFVVLATDGVWDVVTNHEAVQIVSSTPERGKAAKRLVEHAVRAWRRKRRGIAVDDCSAICLFLHPPLPC